MQVVIVYESYFGNTAQVADAVAQGMVRACPEAVVTCVPVAETDPEIGRGADLLVLGGPTHMHGMSSAISRRLALRSEPAKARVDRSAKAAVTGRGLRELIRALPRVSWGNWAAAFDTRGAVTRAGSAAPGIARRLRARGYSLVSRPTGFAVEGLDGPLLEGELERARAWGASLIGRENMAVSV